MTTQEDGLLHTAIDVGLVRRLIAGQFPQWAHLPLTPVTPGGWDNRTFRLGATRSVRLPSAAGYAAAVAKEQQWLPRLAPHLPLPIPVPLAVGRPAEGYPWPWSVYGWLAGAPAAAGRLGDEAAFATDLARFLVALQGVAAKGGPPAGAQSFFRGAGLAVYDAETRAAIATLGPTIDGPAAIAVWDAALDAQWTGQPVWVHGDVAAGNLLVAAGRLAAVIDFGQLAVGDPACDLAIAWTLLADRGRSAFRAGLAAAPGLDAGSWARGRGWALWKALITLVEGLRAGPALPAAPAAEARRVVAVVLAEAAGRSDAR